MTSASGIRKLLHQFGIHSATIQPEFIKEEDEKRQRVQEEKEETIMTLRGDEPEQDDSDADANSVRNRKK